MDNFVEFYFQHGLAQSTQKTYMSAKRRYVNFCHTHHLEPLPASEQRLCQFVAAMAMNGLSHSTLKGYLSGIRHLHLEHHLPNPNISSMARLEQVLRGIKAAQAKTKGAPSPRLPITPDLLERMRQVWAMEGYNPDNVMMWAAVLLCFFGFLRAGEITVPSDSGYDSGAHLSFADISVDSHTNPQLVKVRIKASKTDPFRLGVDVFLGRTQKVLCPVAAVLSYMKQRGPEAGPLFKFSDGRPLTRARFVAKVREALTQAGINCAPYSGHSFRIGAATTAAKQGVEETTIKMLGRWKSSAYQLYIRTPREQLAAVSGRLVS